MRATVIHGTRDVRLEDVPDPSVQLPGDAVVKVVAACVCGSDLWPYRGVREVKKPQRIGHEFVGVVEDVGSEVSTVKPGDFVIAPFALSDNTCVHCQHGVQTSCVNGEWWGSTDSSGHVIDGGQGEYVRVPMADGTLVATPQMPDDALVPALLTLSDVMGTGHHAARAAGVGPGQTVVVVGDGAVGLCAVLAAKRLGAERVVAMSRHADRQAVARRFGADDIVDERGEAGVAAIMQLTQDVGADAVLECVGTKESMQQAIDSTRPGGRVGYVGVPAGGPELPIGQLFSSNISVGGGVAPVRAYLP
jgi:threonine dehydrogenase-like Zn-dependent dehydrogenase